MKTLNQKGFTLVELMVVVAIIGILSAVAIPNFKKYQAKSKQSEAKLQISSVFTAETAYFAEYDVYTTNLSLAGYDPGTTGYYAVGFNGGTEGTSAWAATKGAGGTAAGIGDIGGAGTAAGNSFEAGAGGNISASNANMDQWTINENKVITNSQPGI